MAGFKVWLKAARLRTLPLSLSGIIVGSAIAYTDGIFNSAICGLALLTTLFFQVLSNFANDLGDAQKGADNEGRIGPERAIQSGAISIKQMKNAVRVISITSLISAASLIAVSSSGKGLSFWIFYLVLAALCVLAAVMYTVGKRAYGYNGLGDVFVFIFFGLVSVIGVYYLYPENISLTAFEWKLLFPATTIGALSMAVLNLNNMRDRENDQKVGKNTLVVKLGKKGAKVYHAVIILSAVVSMIAYILLFQPGNYFFISLAIPFLVLFVHLKKVRQIDNEREFDPFLKTVALTTFLLSLLFTLSCVLYHV